jgi:hypothetical protein
VILIDRQWGVDNVLKTMKNISREVAGDHATVETVDTEECTQTPNAARHFEAVEDDGATFVWRCWHCLVSARCTATK